MPASEMVAQHENETPLEPCESRHGLVGSSRRIAAVRHLIDKAARTPFPVLLQGESGTGKEVAARAVHEASDRCDRQFVAIDCGSLVGSLIESELFGHVKGAFSGAIGSKRGLVEIADGGTAFFDEIGELPLDMQVKLLRLIQEGEYRPVGALYPREVNLRIIAATNRDLAAEVVAGRFRQDLFYRLNVLPIRMPALRERKEDIEPLVDSFLRELAKMGLPAARLSPEMLESLLSHSWPGNVRELKHWVERMVALQTNNGALGVQEVAGEFPETRHPSNLLLSPGEPAGEKSSASRPAHIMSLRDGELHLISAALAASDGNRAKAAYLLGVSRTTLYRRMKAYGADLAAPPAANTRKPSQPATNKSTVTVQERNGSGYADPFLHF
jgi:transcriptional regulator with PAS, ATPase and Fis domain